MVEAALVIALLWASEWEHSTMMIGFGWEDVGSEGEAGYYQ